MIYQITHIADGLDPHAKVLSNGSIYKLVWGQFSGLLRLLGDLDELSELKLFYYYDGRKLSIYFSTDQRSALSDKIAENFVNGFAADIYGFKKVESMPILTDLADSVNILRPDAFIPSTVNRAENPEAMDSYYLIRPFEPNESCDHMNFERTLGTLNEPVTVQITLRPCNVSKYISRLAQYQHRLKNVNSYSSVDNFSGIRGRDEWSGIERIKKTPDSVADDIRKSIAKIQLSLTTANLWFDIKVSSAALMTARYIASVFAEETFKSGSYQILPSDDIAGTREQTGELFRDLLGLRSIATTEELGPVFLPIIAGVRKPSTIKCHTDPPDYPEDQMLKIGEDVSASTSNNKIQRGIRIDTSKRHTAVFGINGSGKSTLIFLMLFQLIKRGIPFLVIESGSKTDYRALIKALRRHPDKKIRKFGRKLRLLTPGTESINPPRINPFLPPKGVSFTFHAENILSCFLASAVWPDPLPSILKKSLYRMYHEYEFKKITPCMKRFIEHVQRHINELNYDERVKGDIRSAAETRLSVFTTGVIGRIFQTESNCPGLDEIVSGFTIIEGAAAGDEAFAFLVFIIMTLVSEYSSVTPYSGNEPRFFTFFEELHNLVPPVPSELADNENIKVKASKIIIKASLEARSNGHSQVFIDQSPANIDDNILRNCVTTIVGKQRDPRDVEILAGSMLFGPSDRAAVKKLNVGEFLFFTEGYQRPCLVKVPDIAKQLGLDGSPSGAAVLEYIEDCSWYQNDIRVRVTEELSILEKRLSVFEKTLFRAIDKIKPKLSDNSNTTSKEMKTLQSRMYKSIDDFFRDHVVPMAGLDNYLQLPEDIVGLKSLLIKRYELLVKTVKKFCNDIDLKKGACYGKIQK